MKLLLVGMTCEALPKETVAWLRERRWELCAVENYQAASSFLNDKQVQAVLLTRSKAPQTDANDARGFRKFVRRLDEQLIPTVVWSPGDGFSDADSDSLVEGIDSNLSDDEWRGRFATIQRLQPVVERLDRELRNMERAGERLDRHLRDLDWEMRLAARLQLDFLPRLDEPINGLPFAGFYRPTSWVSGDLFDVMAVDASHTAFYIIDAVGHGVAAGLLTMFIKRTIVPFDIQGGMKKPTCPSVVLARLNDALADQALPNCPFVTACYGLFNHQTLELRLSTGGHPPPLHFGVDGAVEEMAIDGCLLGLQRGETYDVTKVQIKPGEKILFYSDGIEIALGDAPSKWWELGIGTRGFNRSIGELVTSIEAQLDSASGSLHSPDDITLLGFELPSKGFPVS